MELLDGEELTARLKRRKRLKLEEVGTIVLQTCRALHVAHQAGIVHRDLRPGNIMLDRSTGEEMVKVLDFGVAKRQADNRTDVTKDGLLIGTPQFMAPEQARAVRDLDGRADLWSLGVLGDCAGGYYGDPTSYCEPKESIGTACGRPGQCASGYCCNAACSDSCNACNLSGVEGTCSVSPSGASGNPDCSPYLCDGMLQSCPGSCTDPADCADGYTCDSSNACVPSGGCSGGTYDCDGDSGNGCECTSGTGCCGTSCQVQHDNGLGQNWYDCVAWGTNDQAQALKACEAFEGAGTCGVQTCNNGESAVCSNGASDCICWGYAGLYAGWL